MRQNKTHAAWNVVRKDKFKEAIKKVLKSKTAEEAKKFAVEAQKALDKAAKAGTIKKNTASRKISRLMARVNGMVKK